MKKVRVDSSFYPLPEVVIYRGTGEHHTIRASLGTRSLDYNR
jgi:hypothetical protein